MLLLWRKDERLEGMEAEDRLDAGEHRARLERPDEAAFRPGGRGAPFGVGFVRRVDEDHGRARHPGLQRRAQALPVEEGGLARHDEVGTLGGEQGQGLLLGACHAHRVLPGEEAAEGVGHRRGGLGHEDASGGHTSMTSFSFFWTI